MHVGSQSCPKRMTTTRSSSERMAWSTCQPLCKCGSMYDIVAAGAAPAGEERGGPAPPAQPQHEARAQLGGCRVPLPSPGPDPRPASSSPLPAPIPTPRPARAPLPARPAPLPSPGPVLFPPGPSPFPDPGSAPRPAGSAPLPSPGAVLLPGRRRPRASLPSPHAPPAQRSPRRGRAPTWTCAWLRRACACPQPGALRRAGWLLRVRLCAAFPAARALRVAADLLSVPRGRPRDRSCPPRRLGPRRRRRRADRPPRAPVGVGLPRQEGASEEGGAGPDPSPAEAPWQPCSPGVDAVSWLAEGSALLKSTSSSCTTQRPRRIH